MNAESLIGTVLGTCTLQKLIGQGGMGAVFLAQQSRPKRQVAVKVLLPMSPLTPNQLAAFLERFRRETDAAASMEHPNIMPVHEYGEQNGLAYLVMPYIGGGTLRDDLEREGPLPFAKAVQHLEQLAAALEFAHEHNIIHRDIKPANIMVNSEGRLLLGDFGLVKIVAEGQSPQIRLTGAGAPVGTPDYMAPEQVIGEEIDIRADIYALGVILFQMVTGTTPFHGETPMQIAAQHLQVSPPAPQMWRPDLPVAAERVILRAMSKRSSDRYARAGDLAHAFRTALINARVQLDPPYGSTRNGSTGAHRALKGQFDPMRQTASMPKVGGGLLSRTGGMAAVPPPVQPAHTQQAPAQPAAQGGGLLSRTGKFPLVGGTGVLPAVQPGGGLLSRTGKFPRANAQVDEATSVLATDTTTTESHQPLSVLSAKQPVVLAESWGTQKIGNRLLEDTPEGGMRLTGPANAVRIPGVGKPAPFLGSMPPIANSLDGKPQGLKTGTKIALIVMALLVLFAAGMGIFLFVRNTTTNQPPPASQGGPPDPTATANAQATAAIESNIILHDPLNSNTHSWQTEPSTVYSFKDGAYHITNDDENNGRATVLPSDSFSGPLAYQITMTQIAGDDTKPTNSFGMIFRFTEDQTKKNKHGDPVVTFYTFEVVNTKNGEYQFWKYDNSNDEPWTQVKDGRLPFGDEFKPGLGNESTNTIKVFMADDKFTISINGKTLPKTFQDNSFSKGTVGMIVNLKGAEVAFKDLYLTKN